MPRPKQFSDESVLIAAMRHFSARGYYGTSMQDLVDSMGIARGSIYAAFHSKRALFISALRLYIDTDRQHLGELLKNSRSPRTTIMDVFARVVDGSTNGSFIVNATVDMAPHDHEIAQITAPALRDIEQLFLQLVMRGQTIGVIGQPPAAPFAARCLLSAYISLRVQVRAYPDESVLQESLHQVDCLLADPPS